MSIIYTEQGDYLMPDLAMPTTDRNTKLGKYAYLRLEYLKQNKRGLYMALKMKNELLQHLGEIQETALQRIEDIIKKMAKVANITEELKEENQMKWVGAMNNIRAIAEEIVTNELIYV